MTVSFEHRAMFHASAESLYERMIDPRIAEERSEFLGSRDARATQREVDGSVELEMIEVRDTKFPTEPFESRRTIRWDESHRCASWSLVQTAGPGHTDATGTITLVDDGPNRVDWIISVELTIDAGAVSGLIERLARRTILRSRDRDAEFLSGLL